MSRRHRERERYPVRRPPAPLIRDLSVQSANTWAFLVADRQQLRRALRDLRNLDDDDNQLRRESVLGALSLRFDEEVDGAQ